MSLKTLLKNGTLLALAFLLMGLSSWESLLIPRKQLWEHWIENDPFATFTIGHDAWDGLLKRYLSTDSEGINRFDYAGVTDADKELLRSYVQSLASVPIERYRQDEQLAYWINLYNALTVLVVLEHYPVESIRDIDISPGIFGVGPWGKKLVTIDGQDISLNDIEHRILRPIWKDPRVHYALNCASLGCPNLRGEAYTGNNVQSALTEAARAFINSPRAARQTPEGLLVSSIYVWFAEDFGGDDEGILTHLLAYADTPLRSQLSGVREIADHDYDWRLNDPRREVTP